MKANELRIGNLVDIGEVTNISMHTVNVTRKNWLFTSDYNDIKPISLTEDWHNKFGVNKNGFNSFEYTFENKLNLYITICFTGDYVMLNQGKKNIDDCVSIWNKDLTKRDMYVHEFQNLYFMLAGKELELIP